MPMTLPSMSVLGILEIPSRAVYLEIELQHPFLCVLLYCGRSGAVPSHECPAAERLCSSLAVTGDISWDAGSR